MMEKRKVNITFQVGIDGKDWSKQPIVYVLKNVDYDKDATELCHCLSTIHGHVTVRTARLELVEAINIKNACNHNGGYYQAYPGS